jgi:urea transport system ATP-binding protein
MAVQPDYLEIRDLTVSFDGFRAVDGVDLTVFQSDVRFLIGPNGAGKTTIIDALTGLVPGTGSAKYGADQLLGKKPHQIARLGVGRTFQTASVFDELSVLQNLDIAAGARRSAWSLLGVRRRVPDSVAQALETIGLTEQLHRPAGHLSHGQKQWLEIGMLLVTEAKVLLLDEPVAGMSQEERDETGALLRRVVADRTVIIVEHDMEFMRRYADSVTVLHAGKVLSEGSVSEVQADAAVQQVYLGRASSGDAAEAELQAEVLAADGFTLPALPGPGAEDEPIAARNGVR